MSRKHGLDLAQRELVLTMKPTGSTFDIEAEDGLRLVFRFHHLHPWRRLFCALLSCEVLASAQGDRWVDGLGRRCARDHESYRKRRAGGRSMSPGVHVI